jgi:hypothetical protein
MVAAVLKKGAIGNVKAPSLLPSRVLLPLPLLHKQGVANGAKAPSLSTHEKRIADDAKAPCHHHKSGGQLTVPRHYPTGCCQCHHHAREG